MISQTNVANYLTTSPNTYNGYWNWEIFESDCSLVTAFRKIILFKKEEEQSVSFIKNIVEEDLSDAIKLFEKFCASKGKNPFAIVIRYVREDSSIMYTLCRAHIAELSEEGFAQRITGCQMDITGFFPGKVELGALYLQHKLIIDGVNAGIWDWNIKSGITWWSDKMYAFLGYARETMDASYESLFQVLLHPDDRKKVNDMLALHLLSARHFKADVRLLCKDGNYRWFEMSGKSQLDDKGIPIRLVGAIMRADKHKKLRAELERYQFLIDESAALIKAGSWEINFADGTMAWSPAMYEIHETQKSFVPSLKNINAFLHENDVETFQNCFAELNNAAASFDKEFESVTATGNRKWVRIIGKPVCDRKGKVIMARGITQDIHEQKLKDEQIKNSLSVITEKNKRLNDFAHIVSHNLRAHAANIDTILSLIQINNDAEQKKELFSYLGKISANLNGTIDHLTDLIKINDATGAAKISIDVAETLRNVLDVLRPTILETQATVTHDVQEYSTIEYVPAYLESILLNLISNAIKYRKPSMAPRVIVRTYLQDGRKCLSVTDNGLGIDINKYKNKLFGLYNTFHANADARGVGLFITRAHVESLGGSIAVISEPGKGSTFYIQF